jgi:O-antigen/teichoic acid export membrane protein
MPGFAIKRKTIYVLYLSLAGTTINIALNFLLISKYGLQGAAIATSLGALCFLIAYSFMSLKLYPIPFNWYKILFCMLVAGIVTAFCFYMQLNHNATTFPWRVLIFCGLIIFSIFILIGKQQLSRYVGNISLALQRKK